MPWLDMPKPVKHHICKIPRWVGWWRKDRDLWGCPECGYIYKLVRPAHPRRKGGHAWELEDSRGWNSPSWEYLRKNFVSRADEKKMTTEEYDKLMQGFDFNEYRWVAEPPPGGKIISNTLPPLHGGYRPSETGKKRTPPDSYPTPPGGSGGGSR